ncbi:hypothetical protein V8B97DRAFT_2026593 [Scleroderma yunnanense]
MPSTLAAQLAASASQNASLLASKKRRTESYLFTGCDADAHDLDSLHAIAASAFSQLCTLSSAFLAQTVKVGQDDTQLSVDFERTLFSDAAKDMDRTLQLKEVNANLDRTINAFLALLGQWLVEIPTGKVLEWLVRRFRINEFNVDAVLALFLPYHETPHFVKMLSILHIPPTSPFVFLLAFKSAAKPLPRSTLVKNMVSDAEVARFTADLLPTAVKCSYSHRTLLAFNAATMHDYISSAPILDDGMLAFILPALLTPLQATHKDTNVALSSYIILCVLSQKVPLKSAAITVIIGTMATQVRKGQGKRGVSTAQFIKAAVAVCSHQDEISEFPPGVGQICLKMPSFSDEVCNALNIMGFEKFLLPLIFSLQNQIHEPSVSSLLSAVINSTGTPLTMMKRITSMLVRLSCPDDCPAADATAPAARLLLGLVHQRHFELLRDIADDIASTGANVGGSHDKMERKKRTDELLASFSLSHPLAQSADVTEVVVASADASKEVRTDAVHRLYAMLRAAGSGWSLSSSDMESIQSALLGRVYDPHQGVLQALYASSDLFLSTVIPQTSPQRLLDTVVSQLQPTPPARALLSAHVAFLVGPFSKAHPELRDAVQQKAIFPFLLASKSKFRTSRSVWEAIKESGEFQSGWLKGCVEVWDEASLFRKGRSDSEKENTEENAEKVCQANLGVTDAIAENILASDDPRRDIHLLLSKLHDPMPHGRALAYLVCRRLLARRSGDQKIALASQILCAMRLRTLDGTDAGPAESNMQEALDEHHVAMKATIKPGGRGTTYDMQVSIVALIPALPAPQNFSGSWMTVLPHDVFSDSNEIDMNQQYVGLMQSVYVLACSSATQPTPLSTSLLRTLFLNLRESTLAFLLGVLLSTSPATDQVRTHALLHSLAFLRGHSETGVDFQTVLPSLIAVLLDDRTDKRDRALVFECISLLSAATEKKHVYGLDTVYGQASSNLQYLDTKDLVTYVKAIVESRDHLIQDASYITVFHHRHFEGSTAKYKRRALCFLLSHVITHPFPFARIALLHSVEDVSDNTKARMLIPVLKSLTQDSASVLRMFGSLFDEYTSLVLTAFLAITPASLSDTDDNEPWAVFVGVLRHYFQSNANSTTRTLIAGALEHHLFADLDLEKRAEICVILLHAGVQGRNTFLVSKSLLGKLLKDVALIIHLLTLFQPSYVETETPTGKRAKLDNPPQSTSDKRWPLTILAEVLGTTDIPGSIDLISRLLETLNKVVRSEGLGQSDTSYVCQMLMAAIEKSASQITEPLSRPIRLEVLVELIRVTDNSQTFNEALLLMANLARLTPDSVLHNIMPIFTFMGSNVFHRDDSYSFKVVQNTINSIVPVMVSSLRDKHSQGLELYISAREFLRIFTDAAHHVPSHRRQNFFVHLAQVLGPQEFLAPLCMLLVDKVANRVVRQTLEEAQTTLVLPVALLRHSPRPVQIYVLCEVLRECLRLASRLSDPEDAKSTFLDYTRDEEYAVSILSVLTRRVQALLLFTSLTISPLNNEQHFPQLEGNATKDLITLLVNLATLQAKDNDLSIITSAAQLATTRVTNAISAGEFLIAVTVTLESTELRVKIGALEALAEKISLVNEAVRREQKATMLQAINLIDEVITHQSAGALVEAALAALKAIASTYQTGEEVALQSTLPHVMKVIRSKTLVTAGLAVLPCYILTLGPRIIPYFREIAEECVSVLHEGLEDKTQLASTKEPALATLQTLLSSLPAFYGTVELTQIVKLYTEYSSTLSIPSNPLTPLVKSIAKRAASGIVLQVLDEFWPKLSKGQTKGDVNGLIGYFNVLRWSLKAAPRPDVLEHLRQLFKVFIEAFDIRSLFSSDESESHTIAAFTELVVKLNESAFRPLFRKLHDWAFVDRTGAESKMVFCHVYIALLDYFKALMNPYVSMLIRSFTEVLQSFESPTTSYSSSDLALWTGVMLVLNKSFENDDGVVWREDKITAILPHLLSQLPTTIRLPPPVTPSARQTPKQLMIMTLLSLVSLIPTSASDLLKKLNLDLLMYTRFENSQLRILALACASELWKQEGGKLIGFVAETATFIVECAEDENDDVVREAHKLKNAVESVAGSIKGL